jgi:ABC-type uncharacterized transport system substrate-binding protein
MDRRAFIGALAGGVLAAPMAAEAQQAAKIPRIGFLQATQNENVDAFIRALRDSGYVDGQSAVIEMRLYGTRLDRVNELINELVGLKCDVIFAAGPYAVNAAVKATSAIPIVAVDLESDPVANRWAKSLGRPGTNLTGLFLDLPEIGGKQIQLIKETLPQISSAGVLWDSTIGESQFNATEAAARVVGVRVQPLPVQRLGDFEAALERAARDRVQAVVVLSSPLIFGQRTEIASLALRNRLPTISVFTLFAQSGGLMAYGPDLPAMYSRAGIYVDKILKGAKAADLPIERASRFQLVVNLKTAKVLGLTIPQSVLVRADEVIQ